MMPDCAECPRWRGLVMASQFNLTPSETRIAVALCQGYTGKDLSAHLGITSRGVKWKVTSLLKKLKVRRRWQIPLKLVEQTRREVQALGLGKMV